VVAKVERADGRELRLDSRIRDEHKLVGGEGVVAASCVAAWRGVVLELTCHCCAEERTVLEERWAFNAGDGERPVVVLGQDASMPVDNTAERASDFDDASCKRIDHQKGASQCGPRFVGLANIYYVYIYIYIYIKL